MTAHKKRGHLIVTLFRVRAIVYITAGVPVLFMSHETSAAVVFVVSVIVIATITPFLVRQAQEGTGVRAAAASDLIVAYGLWLFVPTIGGLALMLALWAIGYAVLLGSSREGRFVAALAVALQLSKLVVIFLADSALADLPVNAVSDVSPWQIVGVAAGLIGSYFGFNLIDQYFVAVNDAAETGEERYRKLTDTAPIGFVVVVENVIVYANEAANMMLGSGGASIAATKITNYVDKASIGLFKEIRGRVLSLWETVESQPLQFRDIDNNVVWVDLSANPVDYGHDLAMQLMLHDRSGQKMAEEELRQTRLDYRTFFERIPVALYRSQPDGTISHVNQALVELLGANSKDEIIGKDARTYYADESDRDQLTDLLNTEGVVAGYEWRIKTHDGSLRWIRDTSRLIKSPAGVFYEGAMVDVTARRNVEDELWVRAVQQEAVASIGQLALESEDVALLCEALSDVVSEVLATDGVAILQRDSKGFFQTIGSNQSIAVDATMLSGIADRTHMAAAPVFLRTAAEVRFAAPALLEVGYKSCIALMVPGEEIDFGTLVVLSRNERVFTADDLNFLYSVANVLAAAVDRAGTNARLEALVKSKDAFVASVSHELRTPLTVVSGLSHELSQRWMSLSDEEMEEFTSMLVGQSQDMADLIEDLLVAARANIGSVSVQMIPVDVAAEVSGVLAGFESHTSRVIEADVPDATIDADPIRLRQILRNLVSNAIRYGGDEIEVVGDVIAGVCVIEVRDNGDPIAEEDRERIFEPYERAHEAAGRPGSVGLGLSVSRTLAELMRGSLTYYHDGASVFRLELPASADESDRGPDTRLGHDQPLGAFGTIGSSRIGVDVAAIQ